MITSIAYVLLLVFLGALGAAPAKPQSGSDVNLADVLIKGSWYFETSAGPPNHRIALEGRTLTFCACGHVRETIADDTGRHDGYGTWAVERTDHGDVLILTGGLRYHGRFAIKYLEKEKAIDLWIGSAEELMRFKNVKTERDPCATPK